MKMRFNLASMRKPLIAAFAFACVLPVLADRAHDLFDANRDAILSQSVSAYEDVTYMVGRASSSANLGNSVGYSKAEEKAKWNLVECYRESAPWPADIQEDEKEAAWTEYRAGRITRLQFFGMQRVYSKKLSATEYVLVLSVPTEQVNVPAPTATELAAAVNKVRERKRVLEERKRAAEEQKRAEAETQKPVADEAALNAAAVKDQQEAERVKKLVTEPLQVPTPPSEPQQPAIEIKDNFDEDLMI